eukprot:COSAG05_NODE_3052_length_2381_cov_3.333041_3_plen_92_part_00
MAMYLLTTKINGPQERETRALGIYCTPLLTSSLFASALERKIVSDVRTRGGLHKYSACRSNTAPCLVVTVTLLADAVVHADHTGELAALPA